MATLMMEREVLDCEMERAARCIYGTLGASGPGEVTKTFHVGTIARDVLLTLGDLDRKTAIWRIPVSWHVPHSDAFPHFHGFFELRHRFDRRLAIVLLGYYQPPFGTFGIAFDAVAGRHIAHATVSQLLDEILDGIARCEEP
jgi:hypothetical protein